MRNFQYVHEQCHNHDGVQKIFCMLVDKSMYYKSDILVSDISYLRKK